MNVAGTFLSPWAFITETVHFIEHLLSARPFNASFHLTYTILFAFLQVMVSRLGEVIKLFKKMHVEAACSTPKGQEMGLPCPCIPPQCLAQGHQSMSYIDPSSAQQTEACFSARQVVICKLLYTGWFGLQLSASGWDERAQ